MLQGGKFGHGFVSSLVTTSMKGFMNPKTGTYADAVRRTAIAGVVGGTVSKLTGGKFANGAVISAMQWWYNAEQGGEVEKRKRVMKQLGSLRDKLRSINPNSDLGRVEIAVVKKMTFGIISQKEFNNIVNSRSIAQVTRWELDNFLTGALVSDSFPKALGAADPTSALAQVGLVSDIVSSATSSFPIAYGTATLGAVIQINTMWDIQSVQSFYWSEPTKFEQSFSDNRFLLINSHYSGK